MEGIIIKTTGNLYTVRDEQGGEFTCRIKGTFKIKGIKTTNPLAVGDKVEYASDKDGSLITHIFQRKNYIIRKSVNLSKQYHIIAANIDKVYIVATMVAPRTSMGFIDRILVTAEAYSIPACIIFNKTDLYDKEAMDIAQQLVDIYKPLGYECYFNSVFNPEDVSTLLNKLKGQVNLFSGHSGVGKSTLINALNPSLTIKTSDISLQHLKGVHTTTFSEMHPIKENGYIIDTPGIRDFGIVDMDKKEISHYFPEMRNMLNQCQFNNCMHIKEPGCAIKKAVEDHVIHPWRYYSYLSILNNEDIYH